jgi:flavin reductase (DIM6/NTAB) family NADH-FMN oxidoreductase RutF
MNNSSITLPRGEDEFAFAGVTPLPGRRVKAERVAESPVNFECRLTQCIQLQTAAGEQVETWLVLGEVVAVHLDPALLDEHGVYQTAAAEPILRAGGPTAYYGISEQHRFDLTRPTR